MRESYKPHQEDYIFMKRQNQLHKIWIEDIELIQATGDYCTVTTSNGEFLSSNRLKYLEDFLSNHGFVRVHRSYLINIEKIERLDIGKNQITMAGTTIPIGKNYKSVILNQMVLVQ